MESIDNKEKKNKGRKKDPIRNYFDVINDQYCCNFNDCQKKFSYNSSVSVLKYHISKEHAQNLVNNIKINDIMENTNLPELDFYNTLAMAFAKNSLPHSLIDDDYFKRAIAEIKKNPNIEINRKKLRDIILTEGNKINENMLNKLSSSAQPITIALDGWTNVRSNKVTNLLLISNGTSYFYTSIENTNSQNKTEWIVSQLEEKIKFLVSKKINVIAMATDNENLMKSVCKKIKLLFPVIISVPCAAHIVQLCLKKICEIKTIESMIDKVTDIIYLIKCRKKNKTQLYQLQIDDDIKNPLMIIYPVETRWSSIIMCIERMLLLEKYIKVIIDKLQLNLENNFWIKLKSLYKFLEPISTYTNQIQKDNASIYSVWSCFNKIIEHYKNEKEKDKDKDKDEDKDLAKISGTVISVIQDKWNEHINSNIIDASRLLNFDQKFKINKETTEFIIDWGAQYLTTYKIIDDTNIENTKKILKLQINELLARQNEFAYIENTINNLKQACEIKKTIFTFKYVWGGYCASYFELSKVAIAILSIYPTESCVERSFSVQTDVHTLDRNRLSNDIIDAEMNIKWNI
jgi:hypothetical protein